MEKIEEVVIVGGGVAGLATALGLHRKGISCLVLESSTSLRVTGFAFVSWTNAWKALDALGIASQLRKHHFLLQGLSVHSSRSDQAGEELSFTDHEVRCVRRRLLLEALSNELPDGAIRFSSKVVTVEDSEDHKTVHLSDGSAIKTKALVGCDGINSVVARSLGFKRPRFSGRFATRGYAECDGGHGLSSKYQLFIGDGVRLGLIPCDERCVYWFLTWARGGEDEEDDRAPFELKQFVLEKAERFPEWVRRTLEAARPESIQSVPLHYRLPWEILWGDISKGGVCVAGDAMHPVTPDIGQGACTALEDGVVLARCLSDAFGGHSEGSSIEVALKKYGKERRWRCFSIAATALLVGLIQQSNDKVIGFFRDKMMLKYLSRLLLKRSQYDCGSLNKA